MDMRMSREPFVSIKIGTTGLLEKPLFKEIFPINPLSPVGGERGRVRGSILYFGHLNLLRI